MGCQKVNNGDQVKWFRIQWLLRKIYIQQLQRKTPQQNQKLNYDFYLVQLKINQMLEFFQQKDINYIKEEIIKLLQIRVKQQVKITSHKDEKQFYSQMKASLKKLKNHLKQNHSHQKQNRPKLNKQVEFRELKRNLKIVIDSLRVINKSRKNYTQFLKGSIKSIQQSVNKQEAYELFKYRLKEMLKNQDVITVKIGKLFYEKFTFKKLFNVNLKNCSNMNVNYERYLVEKNNIQTKAVQQFLRKRVYNFEIEGAINLFYSVEESLERLFENTQTNLNEIKQIFKSTNFKTARIDQYYQHIKKWFKQLKETFVSTFKIPQPLYTQETQFYKKQQQQIQSILNSRNPSLITFDNPNILNLISFYTQKYKMVLIDYLWTQFLQDLIQQYSKQNGLGYQNLQPYSRSNFLGRINWCRQRIHQIKIQPFPLTQHFYTKKYCKNWRGKRDQESNELFRKHLNIIKYLKLVKIPNVIDYLKVQQITKDEIFEFIMQKGTQNFINTLQGARYFKLLSLQQKISFVYDTCIGLANLHQHGINHNDVTIRNIVKLNSRWKIIDFDFARMTERNIYIEKEKQKEAELLRKEVIGNSEKLFLKELFEEYIFQNSDIQKSIQPVQNINRLSEFYKLKNNYQLVQLFQQLQNKSSLGEQKYFTSKQKFQYFSNYQNLIIGKRDCNKYGLMLLKIIYQFNNQLQHEILSKIVDKFVQRFFNGNIDFQKQALNFKFDNFDNKHNEVNQEILRLICQLLNPSLVDRLPLKLFLGRFLAIFNRLKENNSKQILKNYNIQEIISSIDLETSKLLPIKFDKFEAFGQKLTFMNQLQQLFKRTYQKIQEHQNQFMYIKRQKKLINQIPKYESTCKKHIKYNIQYFCSQKTCLNHQLCKICLHDYYFKDDLQNQHQINSQKYHKIYHIHDQQLHEVKFNVVIKGSTFYFICFQCNWDQFLSQESIQFTLMDTQQREIFNMICVCQECRSSKNMFTNPRRCLIQKHFSYVHRFSISKIHNIMNKKHEQKQLQRHESKFEDRLRFLEDNISDILNLIKKSYTEIVVLKQKHIKLFETLLNQSPLELQFNMLTIRDHYEKKQWKKLMKFLFEITKLSKQEIEERIIFDIIGLRQFFLQVNNFQESIRNQINEFKKQIEHASFTNVKSQQIYRQCRIADKIVGQQSISKASFFSQVKSKVIEKSIGFIKQKIPEQFFKGEVVIKHRCKQEKVRWLQILKNQEKLQRTVQKICLNQTCNKTMLVCQRCQKDHLHHLQDLVNSQEALNHNIFEKNYKFFDYLLINTNKINSEKFYFKLQNIFLEIFVDLKNHIDFIKKILKSDNTNEIITKEFLTPLKQNQQGLLSQRFLLVQRFQRIGLDQFMNIIEFSIKNCALKISNFELNLEKQFDKKKKKIIERGNIFEQKGGLIETKILQNFTKVSFQQKNNEFQEFFLSQIIQQKFYKNVKEILITFDHGILEQKHPLQKQEEERKQNFLKNSDSQIKFYQQFRKNYHSPNLDIIANLNNLVKIQLIDYVTQDTQFVFESKKFIKATKNLKLLKELKISCLNNFGKNFLRHIQANFVNCLISVESHRIISTQIKIVNSLFEDKLYPQTFYNLIVDQSFFQQNSFNNTYENLQISSFVEQSSQTPTKLNRKMIHTTFKFRYEFLQTIIKDFLQPFRNYFRNRSEKNFLLTDEELQKFIYNYFPSYQICPQQLQKKIFDFSSYFRNTNLNHLKIITFEKLIFTYKNNKTIDSKIYFDSPLLQQLNFVECFSIFLQKFLPKDNSKLKNLTFKDSAIFYLEASLLNLSSLQLLQINQTTIKIFKETQNLNQAFVISDPLQKNNNSFYFLNTKNLTNLQYLIIYKDQLKSQDLSWILHTKIKLLSLSKCFCINDIILKTIDGMKDLIFLDLGYTDVSFDGLLHLLSKDTKNQIQKLKVPNLLTEIQHDVTLDLKQWPNLSFLDISLNVPLFKIILKFHSPCSLQYLNTFQSNVLLKDFINSAVRIIQHTPFWIDKWFYRFGRQNSIASICEAKTPILLDTKEIVLFRKTFTFQYIIQTQQHTFFKIIRKCKNLQKLLLHDCKFPKISKQKLISHKLTNVIQEVSTNFPTLLQLSLIDNNIKEIGRLRIYQPFLRKLDLSHNNINTIKSDDIMFQYLVDLNFAHNPLSFIQYPQLKILKLNLFNTQYHPHLSKYNKNLSNLKFLKLFIIPKNTTYIQNLSLPQQTIFLTEKQSFQSWKITKRYNYVFDPILKDTIMSINYNEEIGKKILRIQEEILGIVTNSFREKEYQTKVDSQMEKIINDKKY